jgi:hypothetical protein
MAQPKVATLKQKKGRTRAATTLPEVEETPGASSLELMFPRDYIPLRKDDVKPFNLKKKEKLKKD